MTKSKQMSLLELYRTLSRHRKLASRRSAAWEQNRSAKVLYYIVCVVVLLYLMFIAVMFSMIVNSSNHVAGYELMYAILPFVLLIDFFLRFAYQQTPTQLLKPYALLPLSRYSITDCFLLSSMLSGSNLMWMAMFVPFAIMSVLFSEGIVVAVGFLFGLYLFCVLNSQWYLLCRSLVNVSMWWWALPVAVYAAVFSPWYVGNDAGIVNLLETYTLLGEPFSFWSPSCYAILLGVMAVVYLANRHLQHRLIWTELGRTQKTEKASSQTYSFLGRAGEVGEYLKLEVKSIQRNKNLRKAFVSGTVLIVVFSLLLSFTEVYDSRFFSNFWCVYCFAIYGSMVLSKIMCYEGNYIDCLMVRKEHIVTLLQAKYYFYSAMLLFPFLLMLPTVFTGKCTLLMLVAYGVFTAGAEYFLFFQMAIYNKQTMPLNTKFIGKGSMENNYMQVVVQLFIFVLPVFYVMMLQALFPDVVAYTVALLTGLAFILTHKLWIRNVYRRMMLRRYENMEGLRSSR